MVRSTLTHEPVSLPHMSDPLDPTEPARIPVTAGTTPPAPDGPVADARAAASADEEESEEEYEDEYEDEEDRPVLRLVRDVLETLVLTVVIFLSVQTFVAQPFQVQQVSMQPNFESGEFVLVDKLSHAWDPFGRGDVVVFQPPEEWTIERTPFIKRIVGVAGDTVALVDGRVVLNGTVLEEPYTYRDEAGAPEPTDPERAETTWTLAAGQLFVMGDHRQASLDSRAFGPIRVGDVIGRVTVRYWPLAAFGFVVPPEYGLATEEEGT